MSFSEQVWVQIIPSSARLTLIGSSEDAPREQGCMGGRKAFGEVARPKRESSQEKKKKKTRKKYVATMISEYSGQKARARILVHLQVEPGVVRLADLYDRGVGPRGKRSQTFQPEKTWDMANLANEKLRRRCPSRGEAAKYCIIKRESDCGRALRSAPCHSWPGLICYLRATHVIPRGERFKKEGQILLSW